MPRLRDIPVVDIFAGPGGLAEGFSSFEHGGRKPFNIALSIEKDAVACATLRLRKFVRAFSEPPDEYQAFVSGELSLAGMYDAHPGEAARAASQTWQAELGVVSGATVARKVNHALSGVGAPWVLVGGPPCQAYSLVGRSRMRTTRPDFEQDERHFLYREYLKIVARHRPPVFVMENVKGILSSTHAGKGLFRRILRDLERPAVALELPRQRGLEYRLYGLSEGGTEPIDSRSDRIEELLLRAEQFGVPQARHRVIVVGVRADIELGPNPLVRAKSDVNVKDVLGDLPSLRSRVSRGKDSWRGWVSALQDIEGSDWIRAPAHSPLGATAARARQALASIRQELPVGGPYIPHRARVKASRELHDWYRSGSTGLTLHEARSHMANDLRRYLFAASYAAVHDRSPDLRDFPSELRPNHRNLDEAIHGEMFGDRFRVQRADRPSSTVTSHLAKDGHYFIHYAPEQCRSITVREAARLQTFPDSYFFCGTRTDQYHQVGNAVPPLLAYQVAESIHGLLAAIGRAE